MEKFRIFKQTRGKSDIKDEKRKNDAPSPAKISKKWRFIAAFYQRKLR